MRAVGFTIMGDDDCPICPVLIKDELLARAMELELLKRGFYVIAIGYPVSDMGTARMRMIITNGHTNEQIDKCIKAFKSVGDQFNFFEKMVGYDERLYANLRKYAIKTWLRSWFIPNDDED